MSCRDLFVEGDSTEARLHSRAIFFKSTSSASHKASPTKNRRNPSTQAASQGNRCSQPEILSSFTGDSSPGGITRRFRTCKVFQEKLTQKDSQRITSDMLSLFHSPRTPRLVRGRKSHGSTAASKGDLLQIHPQRKSQSQPREESAEPKHTSCLSGDSARTTGNLVIFTGDLAHCGITRSSPDM